MAVNEPLVVFGAVALGLVLVMTGAWALTLARATLLHDEAGYLQEIEPGPEFTARRQAAFAASVSMRLRCRAQGSDVAGGRPLPGGPFKPRPVPLAVPMPGAGVPAGRVGSADRGGG